MWRLRRGNEFQQQHDKTLTCLKLVDEEKKKRFEKVTHREGRNMERVRESG